MCIYLSININVAMAEDLYVTKEEMAKVTGEFVYLSISIYLYQCVYVCVYIYL